MEAKVIRVAVLGPEYTFSYIAAKKYFKVLSKQISIDFLLCKKIEDVVEAIEVGSAYYGLIPFWNTSKSYIHNAQQEIIGSKNVGIIDNFKMKIDLCLLSASLDIKKIKNIYTIQHVLKQCEIWVDKNMGKVKLKNARSTTDGVQKVVSKHDCAAIGARKAAEHYKLNILAENIQNKKNETLFFVIQRKPSFKKKIDAHTLFVYPLENLYRTKTEVRSMLMECLVLPKQEWSIQFGKGNKKWHFLEVEGHAKDFGVLKLEGKLKKSYKKTRVLGSYEVSITDNVSSKYKFDSN